MRVNVYAEELTNEVQLLSKSAEQPDGKMQTFAGVRIFLASPDVLHHTELDDDRSAITFWLRSGNDEDLSALRSLLQLLVAQQTS